MPSLAWLHWLWACLPLPVMATEVILPLGLCGLSDPLAGSPFSFLPLTLPRSHPTFQGRLCESCQRGAGQRNGGERSFQPSPSLPPPPARLSAEQTGSQDGGGWSSVSGCDCDIPSLAPLRPAACHTASQRTPGPPYLVPGATWSPWAPALACRAFLAPGPGGTVTLLSCQDEQTEAQQGHGEGGGEPQAAPTQAPGSRVLLQEWGWPCAACSRLRGAGRVSVRTDAAEPSRAREAGPAPPPRGPWKVPSASNLSSPTLRKAPAAAGHPRPGPPGLEPTPPLC